MTGRPPSCLCGECQKCRRRVKARAQYQAMTPEERRAWVARRDPEKARVTAQAIRDAGVNWKRENRERAREIQRRANNRYPEKNRARGALRRAIKRGDVVRGEKCFEGGDCRGRIEAHHEDYSKPLDVVWLCNRHHNARHRKLVRA